MVHLEKIELIKGDATLTIPRYIDSNPELVCGLLYLDFDLYEPFVTSLRKNDEALYDQLNQIKQIDFDDFVVLPYFNNPVNLYSFSTFCLDSLRRSRIIQRIKILRVETLASDLRQLGINAENIHEHQLYRPENVSMSLSSRNIISTIFASDIEEGGYL